MSKKPTELESAALTNFTPAGQAALYHIHLAQQAEKDEKAALDAEKKRQEKAREENRPEELRAGEIVDRWIKEWCPPLYQFLDIFSPPHLTIGIFIFAHLAFWYTVPWYFHFVIPWPTTYFIPLYCSWKSIYSSKDRVLWLSYWPILGVLEYFEILLFRDQARSMVRWPKLKAIFCIVMYSIIDNQVILDSRGKPKDKKPIFGAVKLMKKILPSSPREKEKDKEEERTSSSGRENDKAKDKDRQSSGQKARSGGDEKAQKAPKKPK
ncbi:uncharacterized protein I303_102926 [Kwoniella dejecticola CBS 10117]|uniref:Uncharacterized protein n=1 Tax=Kwoniella dejecticola CBS 10117 TaxID=1296121 RepID=A0A1A6AA39_9TREE|nr:uncharacterized protein I303_02946 [Kwoniella dejecticola CBS 10117]OBR86925.1 hypothetical protein I303_02946 [Kwoniella dejecticola CBS 10117]